MQGATGVAQDEHGTEVMLCCEDAQAIDTPMLCCDTAGDDAHDCGHNGCDEVGCNIPLQLKNTIYSSDFSFAAAMLSDEMNFSLLSRNVVSVNLESIWNPPKTIS